MKVLFFATRMPDLCGAFLHDIDLGIELQRRGHEVVFLTTEKPQEGVNGGQYRSFRYMHYTAGAVYLDESQVWICPHAPALPEVRRINMKYDRPIVATCHFDGNYLAITRNNPGRLVRWVEMLIFINNTMEPNYRKNIVPWPPNVVKTAVARPILHEEKIRINEPFQGDYITLVNANNNKGVVQFFDMARKMPTRQFLAVRPYYGELRPPPEPDNVVMVPFDDDIRNVLKKTRILVLPSYYESFGRIALEAMYNGIPVLYSKPAVRPKYPGGSTEGVAEWIGDTGIACERENIDEWVSAILSLDDETAYAERSALVKEHVRAMNIFTEASRIAGVVETFAREHPVMVRKSITQAPQQQENQPKLFSQIPVAPVGAALGFSSGRLRIRR
jgi:glycosyltransferase involved in cell wall biosynthesis